MLAFSAQLVISVNCISAFAGARAHVSVFLCALVAPVSAVWQLFALRKRWPYSGVCFYCAVVAARSLCLRFHNGTLIGCFHVFTFCDVFTLARFAAARSSGLICEMPTMLIGTNNSLKTIPLDADV